MFGELSKTGGTTSPGPLLQVARREKRFHWIKVWIHHYFVLIRTMQQASQEPQCVDSTWISMVEQFLNESPQAFTFGSMMGLFMLIVLGIIVSLIVTIINWIARQIILQLSPQIKVWSDNFRKCAWYCNLYWQFSNDISKISPDGY